MDHAQAYEASVRYIEELTSKCDEVQGNVLAEILSQNIETEYLKRYGISNGSMDRQSFRSKVPIITYDDIRPDIQRIYNGDFSPYLTAQPIFELWLSSGTSSGQPKYIPGTDDEVQRRLKLITAVMPFIRRCIDGPVPDKGKAFTLILTREDKVTPGGLVAHPSLSCVYKNPNFYKDKPYPLNTDTSIIEAIHCPDHIQSTYAQLICGLYQRHHVTRVKAISGSNLVYVVHFLKRHYSELCHDISSCSLSSKITDVSIRNRLVETFMHQPEPELANCIEQICMEENWEGIFKKIWPNAKYLEAIVTGSMAQYIPILKYYSGNLPFVSIQYSSSECDLGFNLNPMCDPYDISYTIMPNMAYYEFLPLESENGDSSDPQPDELVDMANVKIGAEYELVVTSYSGLYRYRLGDVLCPTGFYNSTPKFKMLRRRNVILSIHTDKTTESDLMEAINKVSDILQQFDTVVFEYTSTANIETIPGHYVIYLELMTTNQGDGPGLEVLEKCCLAMENSFGPIYQIHRANELVGPLEIRVVENGTFEKLMNYAILQGACLNQYKVPRCVKLLPMLELLDSNLASTHFSPSVPQSSS